MKKKIYSSSNYLNKKNLKDNQIFLLIIFFFSLAMPFVFQIKPRYEVVLSSSGFSVPEISIPKGATITWKIDGNSTHWPASDNHPTHNIYPEGGGCLGSKLDACREMKKGEKYSFKFDQEGMWGIHDHINPKIKMFVNVRPEKQNKTSFKNENKHKLLFSPMQINILKNITSELTTKQAAEVAYKICSNLDGGRFRDKQQCYAEVYYFITKNTDQKFAFRSIAALRAIDSSARVCHLIAHGIGQGMYDKNPQNWKETIGKVSPECSYGEIHGILEAHSASGSNPFEKKKLPEVCSKNPNWACFHGLGHIIVVQEGNDLNKAADLCYSLPKNVGQLNCLNGVFMEHMIGQGLEEHGIITSERRKLFYEHEEEFERLCSSQTRPDYIRACWTEIIHATSAKYKGNVDDIFAVCKKAQTLAGARGCRLHALAEIIPSKGSDPFKSKSICKIPIPDDPSFERNCYDMISSVIIANLPSKIDEVIDYCSSLEKDYQNSCLLNVKRGIALLKAHDPEQARAICSNDEVGYESVCGNDLKDGYDSGRM